MFTDPQGPGSQGGHADCAYYKSVCEGEKQDGCNDPYPCKAYECCIAFPEGPKQNCVRRCLIRLDRYCMRLPTGNRQSCRLWTHYTCYTDCGYTTAWIRDIRSACLKIVFGR